MATLLSKPATLQVQAPVPAPSWVAGLTGGGPWTELTASPIFTTWLAANANPATGYVGYNAFASVRDAYNNPIFDQQRKKFALWGGGHLSGSFNGVVVFDAQSLTYSIPVAPTPPSKYPPLYSSSNGSNLAYPNTANAWYFQTAATLNPLDAAYAVPQIMPGASHFYTAGTFSDGILNRYYGGEWKANVDTGVYTYIDYSNRYPQQLRKFNSNINGRYQFQDGTLGLRDWVRGKDWVTVIPGSEADNWRYHMARINKETSTIEALVGIPTPTVSGQSSICIAGNFLYVFCPKVLGNYGNRTLTYDRGYRVNLDTLALDYITLSGSAFPVWTDAQVGAGANVENVPTFFDGNAIRFWNYGLPADRDAFYSVNLTPTGGNGTAGNHYLMAVTRETRAASGMPNPAFTYTVDYIAEWGVAMVLPNSGSRWWAIKI